MPVRSPTGLARLLHRPTGLSSKTWREALRQRVGPKGERIWEFLADVMDGKPFVPRFIDDEGREVKGTPMVPGFSDRVTAAKELAHMLVGKPVPMTETVKAEEEAREMEAVRALSDSELEAKVRRFLGDGEQVEGEVVE